MKRILTLSGDEEDRTLILQVANKAVMTILGLLFSRKHMPPSVILWTHRDDIGTDDDPTQRSWIEWMAATFPPKVCQNFVLVPVYRTETKFEATAVFRRLSAKVLRLIMRNRHAGLLTREQESSTSRSVRGSS